MKKTKNVYEALNEIDFDFKDYEEETLNDMEKKKLKDNFNKNTRNRFNVKKVSSIVAVSILTIGVFSQTGFGQNVYAGALSKLTEISYSIGNSLGIERDIESYVNVVDQIVEDNGIEVKLTDIMIDKDELIFSTIFNSDIMMGYAHSFNDVNIYLNGKGLNSSRGGASGLIDGTDNLFSATYDADLKFSNIKDINLDEDIDIKIVLKDIRSLVGESNETMITKGKWEFEFKANGRELNGGTYVIPIDYSFNVDKQTYSLNEFSYNPIKQKIYGSIENVDIDNYNDIKLSGYDNLGHEIEFERSISNKGGFILEYSNINGGLSEQATSMSLVPYAVAFPKENGKMSNDFKQVGEEFTIVLNK